MKVAEISATSVDVAVELDGGFAKLSARIGHLVQTCARNFAKRRIHPTEQK